MYYISILFQLRLYDVQVDVVIQESKHVNSKFFRNVWGSLMKLLQYAESILQFPRSKKLLKGMLLDFLVSLPERATKCFSWCLMKHKMPEFRFVFELSKKIVEILQLFWCVH